MGTDEPQRSHDFDRDSLSVPSCFRRCETGSGGSDGPISAVDLAHSVFGDVREQPWQPAPGEIDQFLRATSARINAVASLHRTLSPELVTDVELGPYLQDLCNHLAALCSPAQVDFICDFRSDCRVSTDEVTLICLIVGELIVNAIRHAHPTGVRGRILVACERCEGDVLMVWVMDDGVGLPEGFDPSQDGGLGLRIVRVLSRQLDAACHFESTDLGLRFRLELPGKRGTRL